MARSKQLFVVKAADDDARGNAKLGREALDGLGCKTSLLTERSQIVFRNQEVGGEGIGFLLLAEDFGSVVPSLASIKTSRLP